jgi:hypothetical protein
MCATAANEYFAAYTYMVQCVDGVYAFVDNLSATTIITGIYESRLVGVSNSARSEI